MYFLFGMVGPDRAIRGPDLVALLGVLGMSGPRARWAILRMRHGGRIESHRRGRVVEYALTAASKTLIADVSRRLMGRSPDWDGRFRGLLFTIPERRRAYRDALRGVATYHGFGSLRPGLLITADPERFSRVEPFLSAAPKGSRWLRVELGFTEGDARRAAAEAWPLDELSRAYAQDAVRMRRAAARSKRDRPRGAAALRALWNGILVFNERIALDPDLPRDVLPEPWPRDAALEANGDVAAILAPAALAYVERLFMKAAR